MSRQECQSDAMDKLSKVALAFESPLARRSIIASYFLVILLAIPLWWNTTSIERQALPVSRVSEQTRRDLTFPVRVALATTVKNLDSRTLALEVQKYVDRNEDFRRRGMRVQISCDTAT